MSVRLKLANSGSRRGAETVQVYVRPQRSAPVRPIKELKAFAKPELEPGEERALSFELRPRDFATYDPGDRTWIAEAGAYDILIGASAEDIRLAASVALPSEWRGG